MPETSSGKEIVAVIEVGSSAIRMVVAEAGPKWQMRTLENLQKPISFGKDVFTTGRLSHAAIRQGIEILENFRAILDVYGVRRMHAVATSAVREAANRDNFLDQVFVRTGIDIEVIEGAEENRLNLIAVENALQGRTEFDKNNCLIMEVGTGSTEVIGTIGGEVALTRTLLVGPVRLPDQAILGKTDSATLQRLLKRRIHTFAEECSREFNLKEIATFVVMGASVRFLARHVQESTDPVAPLTLPIKDFGEFIKNISKLSAEEISEKYGIPYSEAETLYASLLIYLDFLNETKADKIVITMVSLRDGLLLELAQMVSGYKRTDLSRQVIHSARKLGKKYQYDEPHASTVAALAVKLFDLLHEEHGLGSRERLLLEVSAILHDIGTFISPSSHHKHSFYLVSAADIFGLRKIDKDIIANVVRYHRRSPPKMTHIPYMSLPRAERAVVTKLSAILRVADALDTSHQQKCRDFTLERTGDTYILWVPETVGDISLERQLLIKKGDMFTDFFGMAVQLKQGMPATAKT
ncbi:MAG: Ppx/GppA phosphatase family protein [Elusimicrobiota bacterium]|jgi:exopolyphosphatase/guanosine-5'-triphosphate,3'-diphosphate pyrophosphatase